MDIGEVRARTGLTASALHHYEDLGLINSVGRSGLRRQYDSDVVDRLAAIVLLQQGGFQLHEIADLLTAGDGTIWKKLVRDKLAEVRGHIHDLHAIERGLEHALCCPDQNVLQCEHFRKEVAAAIPVDAQRKAAPRPPTIRGSHAALHR